MQRENYFVIIKKPLDFEGYLGNQADYILDNVFTTTLCDLTFPYLNVP